MPSSSLTAHTPTTSLIIFLKSEVVAVITFSIKEACLKHLLQLLLLNKEKNINRYRRIALGNEFKISYVFAVSLAYTHNIYPPLLSRIDKTKKKEGKEQQKMWMMVDNESRAVKGRTRFSS